MNENQARMLWVRVGDACGDDINLVAGDVIPGTISDLSLDPDGDDLSLVRRFLISWCNALNGKPEQVAPDLRGTVPEAPEDPAAWDQTGDPVGPGPGPEPERSGFPMLVGGRSVMGPKELAWRCGVGHGCICTWRKSGRIPDSVWVAYGTGGKTGKMYYAYKRKEAMEWIRTSLVHI